MGEWFEEFFDRLYYETYRPFQSEDVNEKEARFIMEALGLPPGSLLLDLGCGYGRHAVYLARWGYNVVCYDLSDYLLERARERVEEFGVGDRVVLVKGDMRMLDYDSVFDGVYMFFTTFGYFSDEENRDVIRRVSRALKSGGVLLIDVWNPAHVMYNAYLHRGHRTSWFEAGNYIVLEEAYYDIYNGRVNVKRLYLEKSTGKLIGERSFSIRYYTYWELKSIIEESNLAIEKTYGSYKSEKYEASSPRLIIIARKQRLHNP